MAGFVSGTGVTGSDILRFLVNMWALKYFLEGLAQDSTMLIVGFTSKSSAIHKTCCEIKTRINIFHFACSVRGLHHSSHSINDILRPAVYDYCLVRGGRIQEHSESGFDIHPNAELSVYYSWLHLKSSRVLGFGSMEFGIDSVAEVKNLIP
jgi:hypothetical protein